MRQLLFLRGARRIVETCAAVQPGEHVVIVTDYGKSDIAAAIALAAVARGAEVVTITMPPRTLDGEEPPVSVAAALRHCDVVFTPVTRSITHTNAVKEALASGARAIALTAFVEDQLVGGGIDADFEALAPLCRRVAQLLSRTETAHVATPAGTDLTMSLTGRPGNAHTGLARSRGSFATVPNIEASASPVEGSAEGTIVVDASIPYYDIGVIRQPIVMDVRGGAVTAIHGGDQALRISRLMAAQRDPNVYNIAQLSFGLNPHCHMRGVMLDDEGVYGTCHIGIGTSTMLGGTVKAKMHYDVLMWRPTLTLDGDVVLREGEWLLPEAAAARV